MITARWSYVNHIENNRGPEVCSIRIETVSISDGTSIDVPAMVLLMAYSTSTRLRFFPVNVIAFGQSFFIPCIPCIICQPCFGHTHKIKI